MYNDLFGGFDFNGDGHIDGYEHATAIDFIDSMSDGYSGSGSGSYSAGSRYRRQNSSYSLGRTGCGNSKAGNYKRLKPAQNSFCNIYGGYYAKKKDRNIP